jgi:hypothetical protein
MFEVASTCPRRVLRSFEAWDPAFGMTVVLSVGTMLDNLHIVFDRRVSPAPALVRWAVEFRVGGVLYRAAFDRVMENSEPAESAGGANG